MRNFVSTLALVLSLLGLIYVYLLPGSQTLVEKRRDVVMSDGTDVTTLPYAYDQIIDVFEKNPSRLFYGAVYVDPTTDPERGIAHWMPWSERWLVILHSNFFPIEQISTAFTFSLMLLDAICMFLLSRYMGWSRSISSGLSIAWALSAYTRARAKVHPAMVGTYHLPLIFLGLLLIVRGRSKKSLALAALALLLAGTTAHYYLVTCLFLSPLFLLFVGIQSRTLENFQVVASRLFIGVLPLCLFLGFNFLKPVPSDAKMSASQAMPTHGEAAPGEVHPFLLYFSARPIDYLAGDIALQQQPSDLNPLREMVNEHIRANLEQSNPHERTNGIRWSILALAALALLAVIRGKFANVPESRRNVVYFSVFGLIGFLLSLSPNFPFPKWGLSYWLHELISQIRVPSRAGINVHFALLMMSGFLLSLPFASVTRKWNYRRLLTIPGVFAVLMVLDYPPLVQTMPMSPVAPAVSQLHRSEGNCGAGMYFPFVNFYVQDLVYYSFLQRMRGSDCAILNGMSSHGRLQAMLDRFPPTVEFIHRLERSDRDADVLVRLAQCVPLNWVVFDPAVPPAWSHRTCQRLGWTFDAQQLTCIAPNKGMPLRLYPEQCP